MTSSQIGRTGKQIRERWHNQLDPDIKKDSWTQEEDRALIEAYQVCKIILFVAAYFWQIYLNADIRTQVGGNDQAIPRAHG